MARVRTLVAAWLCVGASSFTPSMRARSRPGLARRVACRGGVSMELPTVSLKRVVVTGMGITSCLGNTLDDVLESLKTAKSGITANKK